VITRQDLRETLNELELDVRAREQRFLMHYEEFIRVANECEELKTEAALLTDTESLLFHISSQVLGSSTGAIDKLVTAGLQVVFEDQNLALETELDKQRGKTAIKLKLTESGETAPIRDGYGGGVLALVGVLLRVTTILILDLRRFLVLDESLSHVSDQYIHPTSKFLKKLCEDLGFEILMVTHQQEFAEYADRHFEAKRIKGKTVIKEQSKG